VGRRRKCEAMSGGVSRLVDNDKGTGGADRRFGEESSRSSSARGGGLDVKSGRVAPEATRLRFFLASDGIVMGSGKNSRKNGRLVAEFIFRAGGSRPDFSPALQSLGFPPPPRAPLAVEPQQAEGRFQASSRFLAKRFVRLCAVAFRMEKAFGEWSVSATSAAGTNSRKLSAGLGNCAVAHTEFNYINERSLADSCALTFYPRVAPIGPNYSFTYYFI
jgi:hypothetical protein